MARSRVGKRTRQLLVFAHVAISLGWMGAGAANVVLAMTAGYTSSPDVRRVSYQLIVHIDDVLVIPGAAGALVSGLVLCAVTPWGFARYWWVLLKTALTVAVIVYSTVGIGVWVEQSVLATAAADVESPVAGPLAYGVLLNIAAFLLMTWVSVAKPWGTTPWTASRRPVTRDPAQPSPTPVPGRGRNPSCTMTTMTARTGRTRVLVRMVVANRPWRLVLGMRSALAAVLATSAYLVITSTIWSLASSLSLVKLGVTMVAAVAMMVAWIVGAHHLWRRRDDLHDGEDLVLWNASTVLTLLVGVVTMAVAVFVFNIAVTVFFLEPPVYTSDAGTAQGLADHVRLAWLATAFATVAGAVGSGLDSDAAVEAATRGGEQRGEAAEYSARESA